ncbi:Major facilitator superfamily domain containing protein [Rhypophila sp. PSN 637]
MPADTQELAIGYSLLNSTQYSAGLFLISRLNITQGLKVLDVGCGPGNLTAHLAHLVGANGSVVGIDPSEERIAIAAEQYSSTPNLEFHVGIAEDLSRFADASFDLVFVNSTLHWVQDQAKAIREFARVLRPGGKLGTSGGSGDFETYQEKIKEEVLSREPYNQYQEEAPPKFLKRSELEGLLHASGGFPAEKRDIVVNSIVKRAKTPDEMIDWLDTSSSGKTYGGIPLEMRPKAREEMKREWEKYVTPGEGINMVIELLVTVAVRARNMPSTMPITSQEHFAIPNANDMSMLKEKIQAGTDSATTIPSTSSLTSLSLDDKAIDHELVNDIEPQIIIVSWDDAPDRSDPENPLNWRPTMKWANILMISVISFLVPLVSSMLAPAVPLVMADLNTTSKSFATFCVSIFVLGFACGPLILAPLSERYGRVIIYNISNVFFTIFTVMCGLSQNETMFLVFRFLSGFAGVATITIGSGTIADMMPREERGRAVSIWAVGTIMGPAIGPVIGGWLTGMVGWRWMFWIISIVIAIVSILAFLILKETYAPVLLSRKAAILRRSNGNTPARIFQPASATSQVSFTQNLLRPTKLLLFRPLVTMLCTYVATLYGTLYLLFATYSFLFTQVYRFTVFSNGLVFLAGGIGTLFGLAYMGYISDRIIKSSLEKGIQPTPEDRLSPIITLPGSLTFPLGLLIYGWGAQKELHWIIPQIGTGITGFGSIIVFTAIQTYLIDAFEARWAASVIGANAVLRGIAGAVVPLAGLGLYENLGWGWGNSLLGFVSLGLAPLPILLGVYGGVVRGWNSRGLV